MYQYRAAYRDTRTRSTFLRRADSAGAARLTPSFKIGRQRFPFPLGFGAGNETTRTPGGGEYGLRHCGRLVFAQTSPSSGLPSAVSLGRLRLLRTFVSGPRPRPFETVACRSAIEAGLAFLSAPSSVRATAHPPPRM